MSATLRDRVFEALDNALDNGYATVLVDDPEDVAEDLITYDASLGDEDIAELIPLIEGWQDEHMGDGA